MNLGAMNTLHFAGKNEYLNDLQKMRELIRKDPYVRFDRKMEVITEKGNVLDDKIDQLESKLNTKEAGKAPTGLTKMKLQAQLKLTKARAFLNAARGLSKLLVFTMKTGEDVSGKQQPTEKVKELRAIDKQLNEVGARLRAETDPQKADWLKEFEQQQGKLSKDEQYFLNKKD